MFNCDIISGEKITSGEGSWPPPTTNRKDRFLRWYSLIIPQKEVVMGKKLTTQEFIARARKAHNGFYLYDKTVYVNMRTKVIVTCPKHGDYSIFPQNHMKGHPCFRCKSESHSGLITKDLGQFLIEAREVHGDKYDYSQVVYNGYRTKVVILCPKHGSFSQKPVKHTVRGRGCPKCGQETSVGEERIREILSGMGEDFIREKCADTGASVSRFDFYLPDRNTLIEYHGRQHYETTSWGGEKGLKKRQKNDQKKVKWAQNNGFSLIVIPYWEFERIEEILRDKLL